MIIRKLDLVEEGSQVYFKRMFPNGQCKFIMELITSGGTIVTDAIIGARCEHLNG